MTNERNEDLNNVELRISNLENETERLKEQLTQMVALVESVVNQVKNSDKKIYEHETKLIESHAKLEMLTKFVVSKS